VELDSDPSSKVSGLSLVDEKNMVERGDPTEFVQSGSPTDIRH